MDTTNHLAPDVATIRAHLERITARWGELPEPVELEIRVVAEHRTPFIARYAPDAAGLQEAAEWAASMNAHRNVYAVINPIRANASINGGSGASDKDIAAAFYCWADCDDEVASANVRAFAGPRCTMAVITGTIPFARPHVYWELDAPQIDLVAWRALQVKIAASLKSDPVVVNPSRIMRLAGTVTHPAAHKRARGYVNELTTWRTEYPDPRPPVAFDRLDRVFATMAPAAPASAPQTGASGTGAFAFDTGATAMDRALAAAQIAAGDNWHNNVVRLVASYVARGLGDAEIHAITDNFTLPGYTVDDTRREVQTAIDGARNKGWAPDPARYADLTAVAAPAPTQPPPDAPETGADASRIEWWDDITPAIGGAYLVKGVLDRGAMSVVYGASNSGKTFFALDLAYHIAGGLEWRGHRVGQAGVLYLAAEGGRMIANRVAALKIETGLCDIPFALRRAGMDLLKSTADLQTIIDLSAEVSQRHPIGLVVIDTLSRVIAGGDENSAADMTALIRNIDAVRGIIGAHVMLIHHSGKDESRGARGHSSLRAATDTEIEVTNSDGTRAASVTKQRDHAGGDVWPFDLKSVHLGTDQDGDEVSSAVVIISDADEYEAKKAMAKGLGGNQKIIADTFDLMLSEGLGRPNPGGTGFPEPGQFWCVEASDLARMATGKITASNPGNSFRAALKALLKPGGAFVQNDGRIWRMDRKVKGAK